MVWQCRVAGVLAAFCVSGFASSAFGGYREDSLIDYLDRMRSEEVTADETRVSGLHDTLQTPDGTHDKRLVSLALGVNYLESNPRLAMQYLTSADIACRDGDPLLPIIRYYLAQVKLKSGAYQEAISFASSLLERDRATHWGRLLYGTMIEAAYGARDYEKLVATFEEFTKSYSFSRRQEALAHYAAEAFERRGELARATELLEELARGYPTTEESRWAFGRLTDLTCEKTKAGHPKYHFSTRLLEHLSRNAILGTGLKDFVIDQLERPLIQDDGGLRTMTASEKANFLFKARFYREALAATTDLYDREKSKAESKILPEIIFSLGKIYLKLWEPATASRYFSEFLATYPRHPNSPRAYEYMGDALRNAGLPLAAADSYARAQGGKDSRLLRWHQFWNLYRAKKLPEALELLERHDYVQPRDGDDMLTVTYWHARILERLGRKAEADQKYMEILAGRADSYYANLVAAIRPDLIESNQAPKQIKNEPRRGFSLAAKVLEPASSESDGNTRPTIPYLRLVDDLVRVGLSDAAKAQLSALKWATFDHEEAFAAVSKVALMLNDYNPTRRIRSSSFSALKTLPTNWWDYMQHQLGHADEWKIYYPMAFNKTVTSVASKIRINPFLVLSVMRTESFYNKDARSGVGAQGLMQLMPYTATKIATLIHDQSFDVLDLAKPEVNIGYGSYYLDKLLRYYGDNPFLAVAAYNGGPVVVNQWLGSCKDCSADEFVESVQYRETRRYVREVMRNYAQYVRIYTGKQALGELPPMPAELPDGEEIF